MKLWVDDERLIPVDWLGGDDWATTSIQAISFLRNRKELGVVYEEVSLDHDLGAEDTGFIVLDWMIENSVWPKVLTIHTANPPARKRMLAAANVEAPEWVEINVIHW